MIDIILNYLQHFHYVIFYQLIPQHFNLIHLTLIFTLVRDLIM